jgi:hypothetical protein
MAGAHALCIDILEHNFNFDGISVEAAVHIGGLDHVQMTGQTMGVLHHEWQRDTSVLHANATEQGEAQVAFRGHRRANREQVLAIRHNGRFRWVLDSSSGV